ncbi:MAG: hypothetical protein FJX68_12690 [Alphaproteobacteria bacterium]|nr:hypothetical protein [Alphaproteobacteria bacterium]
MPDEEDTGSELSMGTEAAVADIANSLGLGNGATPGDAFEDDVGEPEPQPDEVPSVKAPAEVPLVEVYAPPQSWAKDKHEIWSKMAPEAQAQYLAREKQMHEGLEQYKADAQYGKRLRDVFTPYKAVLSSQGLDESQAAQYLMNAHYRMTTGSPAERQDLLAQLARSYGVDPASLAAASPALAADPAIKALQDQFAALKDGLTAQEQTARARTMEQTRKQVEAFAADPKHAYFDEVADDIAGFVKGGMALDEAYEKAVWANPVTRQKELARVQTEREAEFKAKVKADAEAARKASAANVRGHDTRRTPTEPKGTMEDTMRATLREINSRGAH